MIDPKILEEFKYVAVLVGYYLAYSIRSGSKTQDVFKSLLGIGGLAAVPTAAASFNVLQNSIPALLGAWGSGAIAGFVAYFVIAGILAIIYSRTYTYIKDTPPRGVPLFAEILGKVVLGEDFRPKP